MRSSANEVAGDFVPAQHRTHREQPELALLRDATAWGRFPPDAIGTRPGASCFVLPSPGATYRLTRRGSLLASLLDGGGPYPRNRPRRSRMKRMAQRSPSAISGAVSPRHVRSPRRVGLRAHRAMRADHRGILRVVSPSRPASGRRRTIPRRNRQACSARHRPPRPAARYIREPSGRIVRFGSRSVRGSFFLFVARPGSRREL